MLPPILKNKSHAMQNAPEKYNNDPLHRKLITIEDLKGLAAQLKVDIDAQEDVSILAQPVRAGSLLVPSSLAIHPMEGADSNADGNPGELTLRRYQRFAAGGAGLIWVEATAVIAEGRSNPRQLWLHNSSKAGFAAMVTKIRNAAARSMGPAHKPVIVLQLTHSGRYSKPSGTHHPVILQRDPYRDALKPHWPPNPDAPPAIPPDWPILTDDDLDKLVDAYVAAARIAFEVGFDAVDIKSCHGYLISELLACHNRPGRYGGSFENRTRFLLDIIDRIHHDLGPDKTVVTRLGVYDAVPYPYGFGVDSRDYTRPDLTEPQRLIAELCRRSVPMVNITIGDPHFNPHYGRPFDKPVIGGCQSPEHPLIGAARIISLAGRLQKASPGIAVVGTGYSWFRTLTPGVAAAAKQKHLASLIGVGRLAFAYPDFAKDIISTGALDPGKVCIACSKCSQILIAGGMIGCAVRDGKIYGPIYDSCRKSTDR